MLRDVQNLIVTVRVNLYKKTRTEFEKSKFSEKNSKIIGQKQKKLLFYNERTIENAIYMVQI